MTISVIIPVLNERTELPSTLASLRRHQNVDEIIVVDGGSSDGTLSWLSSQPDVKVLSSVRGKGAQLRAGVAAARGEVLLFLHADCRLARGADEAIRTAISAGAVGGAFLIRFPQQQSVPLRLVQLGINLRTRITRTATGDQAIFVRRDALRRMGGVPDLPLFEDVELVRRAKWMGKFSILRGPVTISPRRYLRGGALKTTLLIYALRLAYQLGVSPAKLKRWFDDDARSEVEPRKPLPTL